MTDHPPFVSVAQTLIRVNATAMREQVPEWVDFDEHLVALSTDDQVERLYIEFDPENGGYKLNERAGGAHTSVKSPRERILNERGTGRYDCWWDTDREVLVADLTVAVDV